MSSITSCDICDKCQNQDDKNEWLSLSVLSMGLNKISGLDSGHLRADLCPSCGQTMMTNIIKVLKKDNKTRRQAIDG